MKMHSASGSWEVLSVMLCEEKEGASCLGTTSASETQSTLSPQVPAAKETDIAGLGGSQGSPGVSFQPRPT